MNPGAALQASRGTAVLGRHELLLRLAAGGAANVFLVRDLKAPPPGRLLALKVLLPQLAANEDFLNMFFTEARIASRLHHPNIVAIAGFGQNEGIHCLAMEFVFGASLAQVLRASAKAKKPLTVGVLLRITASVCDALHYAHELKDDDSSPMRLVHRDVTPQNILIGFNGVPKLTDFGIAKATNRGWETQAGIVKGKFSYMSPEQALGKKVDRRSDIFCTGIVLWEALTGRELFKGTSPLEVIEAIRKQPIPPPSKVVSGLSPIVDPIVMKALRRSPRQRYQTAAEMRDDIENLIQRAGVRIDTKTISAEFAEIFGDVIVDRAFALRNAMGGKADLDQLASALGGMSLRDDHLPKRDDGLNDPDPLGLFEEPVHLPMDEAIGIPMPARSDDQFNEVEIEIDEASMQEGTDDEVEADIRSLEPASDLDDELFENEGAPPEGWDDSTRMMVPDDELLSMLSEEDATIGMVPQEFMERFGSALRAEYEREEFGEMDGATISQDSEFDNEATVDTSRFRGHIHVREESNPVAPSIEDTSSEHRAYSARNTTGRPIPRAPSLDMPVEEVTPVPEIEVRSSAPLQPIAPKLPPPPPPATKLAESLLEGNETYDDDAPLVEPMPLEAPPGESDEVSAVSHPGHPSTFPPRSAPYSNVRPSSVPSEPVDLETPLANVPPPPAARKSAALSADALRELAEGPNAGPRSPSHPGYRMMSAPGHEGHQELTPDPSVVVHHQSRGAMRVRPVLLVLMGVLLVLLGAVLGVLLMKYL